MRLVCCIALCVLTRTCAQLDSSDGESSQLPSIVFLVADDLGSYDLSLTNPERHTPTIDRLAREGVQFSRYYSYKFVTSVYIDTILLHQAQSAIFSFV